ncbi:6,7-dimethyl-8-ribityllumazine synthase [Limnochorda pilosa]|uniref:6,7-dimethyl-8-ribityllumazine synthase n=1 Tax=Limnochorda pilosa TaxID=1555112 RepID=UPI000836A27C
MDVEGSLEGRGVRVGVVVARFNSLVTDRLLEGALGALRRMGVPDEAQWVARVPGSFEIPAAARALALSGRVDAIACLGAVVRGETAHFEHVAREAVRGVQDVALSTGVPCTLGILTTESLEQALDRAGGKAGNKGAEAAQAAVEMATLLRRLKGPGA